MKTHGYANTQKLKFADAKEFMKQERVYEPELSATSKPRSSTPTPTNVNVLLIIITTVLQHNTYLGGRIAQW